MASVNESTDWGASSSSASLGYLTPGHTISGTLSSASDVDWIRVPMAAQQTYTLSSSGSVSVYLTDLSSTWNFSGGALSHTATHPSNEYFLVVSGAAGSYALSVAGVAADGLADEAGASVATAGTLSPGSSIGGVINGNDTTSDKDWFAVDLTAGESYSWAMTPTNSVVGALAGGLLKLYDASGAEMTTTWSASAWTDGASLSFTPETSGTYYLEAASYYDAFNQSGSYILDMTSGSVSAPATTATLSGITVTEGDSGAKSVSLTLSLSAAAPDTTTVTYRTIDGTATAGSDYTAVTAGSVTFAAGESSKVLTFSVTGDTAAEEDEAFYVQLTGAIGAKLSASQGIFAQVAIANDDGGSSPPTTVDIPEVENGVYRFYNSQTGTHFYSGSHAEAEIVASTLPQYSYEGLAYSSIAASDPNATAFYRFYHPSTGTHFYTSSAEERDLVEATLPQYSYEGIGYYLHASQEEGDLALYRFYNTANSTHFYTANEAERDSVIATLPQYTYEGPVGFVDAA